MSAVDPEAGTRAGAAASLVERIRTGDKAAESEFVREYERGVRALVRRHARPGESMVDDFVQDVLHTVLEKLRHGDLRDSAALPAYLRTTIVHITTAEYRRRAARGAGAGVQDLAEAGAGADPAEALRAEQLATQLRSVLAELPLDRDRLVLMRFYLDEHDKDAICADLAIDPGHFRRVLFRARERLRDLLMRAGISGAPT